MHDLYTSMMLWELRQKHSALPPWWPESVWKEETDAVEQVDSWRIDLPFYQMCYSEAEARMFIHVYSTPEGHDYALGATAREAQRRGAVLTPEQVRVAQIDPNQGISGAVVKMLDPADKVVAKAVFTTSRQDEIRACVALNYPKAVAEADAERLAAINSVVVAHRSELEAAKARYESGQKTPASPAPTALDRPITRQQDVPQPPAPAQPISRPQLDRLFEEQHEKDQDTLLHEQLEKKRTTLPPWFPSTVWDDVEKRAEAVSFADVAFPVYQRYMSSDQADMMILLFDGPIGQKIATELTGRSMTPARAGHTGSDSDREVAKTMQGDNTVTDLFVQRFAELTAAQITNIRALIPSTQAIIPRIEDESDAAYNKRINEVVQETLARHQAELAKAQQNPSK